MRLSFLILTLWLWACIAHAQITPESESKSERAFVGHLPVASAPRHDARLRFDVRGADRLGTIVVLYRVEGTQEVRSSEAQRDSLGYVAILPPESLSGDSVAYWVVERANAKERALFASAEAPQRMRIWRDAQDMRERRLLRGAGGRRSRLGAKLEWVDMGNFRVENPAVSGNDRDRYYQIEGRYAFRFYRAVEELEVALGALDGDLLDRDDLERKRVALQYGRAAITFAFGDFVRLRPGMLLGISTIGFELGGDLALLLGDRDGTEFELSGGIVGRLGGRVSARLGWATVPKLPMGARIEVTNFPNNDLFGVRLLFDIGYRFGDAFLVRVLAGYRGRTSLSGGPSLGLELGYAF